MPFPRRQPNVNQYFDELDNDGHACYKLAFNKTPDTTLSDNEDEWIMPLTAVEFPILQHFFCIVESRTGLPIVPPPDASMVPQQDEKTSSLPGGIVLGPDGKPCRTCTSSAAWKTMMRQTTNFGALASGSSTKQSSVPTPRTLEISADCPPDVEQLGRSSWTLLHTLTANYPERPTLAQQTDTKQFLSLFSKMYPCWVCAEDFRSWMAESKNAPRVSNRDEFGRWMCDAHNAVNEKLGKSTFDCNKWEERWRTGWKDGRCD